MTIIDAGPIVAILNRQDRYHQVCVEALPSLALPFVTTLPVLTEAMHFLGRAYGWLGQARLWDWVERGHLVVEPQATDDLAKMRRLMEKYHDAPMDIADASLVVLLEAKGLDRVFTLDDHFRAYRLPNRRVIDVVPASR